MGVPRVGGSGAVYFCIPALCWIQKRARQLPNISTVMGMSPMAPPPSSPIPGSGINWNSDPYHPFSILVPSSKCDSRISWLLRRALPSGLCCCVTCRPGRSCRGEARKDAGRWPCSPHKSVTHPRFPRNRLLVCRCVWFGLHIL